MSKQEWDALTRSEEAFMVNSYEIDILPGVRGDLDQSRPVSELAEILLALIDRGWIEVRRIAPWASPSEENGFQPGELVPRHQLPAVLEDAAAWEYPEDGDWVGALTLVETEAGKKITRLSPEKMAE
ncbi:hypothetical protein [Streptomyces sp. NBC_01217]|uniref:hypothetical protein n=1 Tax=Streptomyces sp. NBC_01217 TaxID=2903779 RepID=UPI002E113AE0|nr:hypothetical protein OG507_02970 [Streptomyces sp. NBC_01217]